MQILKDNIFSYQKYSILDEIKQKLFVDKYYNTIGMAEVDMERFKDTGRFLWSISLLREAELNKSIDLIQEWREAINSYEEKLHKHSYFDFTMIITEVIKNLRNNNDFKNKILTDLKYLVVDEYQDVNPIQEELIIELSKSDCNICVVGDDDQTLYEWRLSDVRYIQEFKNRYKDVNYIKLEDNFRSSKGIIDSALKCITNNNKRIIEVTNIMMMVI